MPFDTLNIGTNPNDGTGDTLRAAGQKINANFARTIMAALSELTPAANRLIRLTGASTADLIALGSLGAALIAAADAAAARGVLELGSSATRNVGQSAGTVAAGDDARFAALADDVAAALADLATRAPIDSPTLTGDPKAPTPATADNDTSIATTAFVKAQGYAPLASPTLTGDPTAPTASANDDDTSIATTAFVQRQIGGITGDRNRVINPSGRVRQYINANVIVTANATTHISDCWLLSCGGSGYAVTASVVDSGDTDGDFTAQRLTVSTAKGALAAADFCIMMQKIEGYNFEDFLFGTARSKTAILSFRARASANFTAGAFLRNNALDRSYVSQIALTASWQSFRIAVPAMTSGTWPYLNDPACNVGICIGAGTTYSGTGNAWSNSNLMGVTGSSNILATVSNWVETKDWSLTPGNIIVPYSRRHYSLDLQLAQRYYQQSYNYGLPPGSVTNTGASVMASMAAGINTVWIPIRFPVRMRTTPTVIVYSAATGASGVISNLAGSSTIAADSLVSGDGGIAIRNSGSAAAALDIFLAHWGADARM